MTQTEDAPKRVQGRDVSALLRARRDCGTPYEGPGTLSRTETRLWVSLLGVVEVLSLHQVSRMVPALRTPILFAWPLALADFV